MSGRSSLGVGRGWVACAAVVVQGALAGCAGNDVGEAGDPSALAPLRDVASQRAALSSAVPADPARLVVKFAEGTDVRLRGGHLRRLASGALPAAARISASELAEDLTRTDEEVSRRGLKLGRMFELSEQRLAALRRRGEQRRGRELADLNLYFAIPAEQFASASQMEALRDRLNRLDSVEVAYVEPMSEGAQINQAPDANTDDYTGSQGYGDPAPTGIDIDYASTFPGGRGAGVDIIDMEFSWNVNHEDLPSMAFTLGLNAYVPGDDHGTAVLGVLAAVDNGFGITGLVHDARVGYSGLTGAAHGGDTPGAILSAVDVLADGDVLLIEQHRPGPVTTSCSCNAAQCNYLPLEFWPADYDAIATATANGITVVEAAGNGNVNLDDPAYGGLLSRNGRDSGAILVGASLSTARTSKCFSNHGSRLDVHAWGENVATLGNPQLGDHSLYAGSNFPNDSYWKNFSGTSSATPIVASAVAAVQGVALDRNGTPLSPLDVRQLLRTTGTPQAASDANRPIGPMPDLRRALDALVAGDSEPSADFTVDCDDNGACSYRDTSSAPFGQVVSWQWMFDDGSTSQMQNPTHVYSSFGSHAVTLSITDNEGNADTSSGNTVVEPYVCGADESVLSADFEQDLGPFTPVGSASRSTSAAAVGSYGVRVRGTGSIEAVLDLGHWRNLRVGGWGRGTRYDDGEVIFLEVCILQGTQCDSVHTSYQEVPAPLLANETYLPYTVWPFGGIVDSGEVRIRVGGTASSTFEYADFDAFTATAQLCIPAECLNDDFCASGSCDPFSKTCQGGGGAECGDGTLDSGESCDDGNLSSCDGCSASCEVEACGNGVVECGETCDDSNTTGGDGCSASCQTEQSGDCEDVAASLSAHTSSGRASASSAQDCSSCWFSGCRYPSGCATTSTTYYAVGSGELLGTQAGSIVTLSSEDGGITWNSGSCGNSACTPSSCNDGDACTTDSCNPVSGCEFTPIAGCGQCTPNGSGCTSDGDCCSGDCGYFSRTCR